MSLLFQHYIAFTLVVVSCLSTLAAPRELAPLALAPPPPPLGGGAGSSKAGGLIDCWNALTELRSCTNEIVLFFLNGDTYLSLPCCSAVRVITRNCWPAMIASLGFTSEEADILRGYCDAETTAHAPTPSSHVPAPTATTSVELVVG